MTAKDDNDAEPQAAGYAVMPRSDIDAAVVSRKKLIEKAHREKNTAAKIDTIVEISDVEFSLIERLYHESRERHEKAMADIESTKGYFVAEFESINEKLDNVQQRLDTMATKNDLAQMRKEMQTNQAELRKKLAALLMQK
tara:strand:+ start:9411 stop:9830 length:420 start_codon:yes stop_codon:yes gene_type:complete